MVELWSSLDFLGFSNYEVSTFGRIYNINTKYYLQGTDTNGYVVVGLYDVNGKFYPMRVHILVTSAFYGVSEVPGTSVDHINRDRSDNRLVNLRYFTAKQQANNRNHSTTRTGKRVCQYDTQGNLVRIWNKIKAAKRAEQASRRARVARGLKRSKISDVCRGQRETAAGFIWRYYIEHIPDEIWVPSPYQNLEITYVSSYGRIIRTNGDITSGFENNGYVMIGTYENFSHKYIEKRVHRIVDAAFFGINDELEVNHKDGNKLNNHVNNLEFCSC